MKKTIFISLLSALVVFTLMSCGSEADGDAENGYDSLDLPVWQAEPVLQISDSDELMLQSPASIGSLDDDHIYVFDFRANRLHVLNEDGTLSNSFLREGRGPGEIQMPNPNISINEQNQLLVFSMMLRRFSLYGWENESLIPVNDFSLESFPMHFHLMPDGNVAYIERSSHLQQGDEPRYEQLHLINTEGERISESVLSFQMGDEIVMNTPDGAPLMSFASPHHPQLQYCFQDEYLFKIRQTEAGFSRYRISDGELITEVRLNLPDSEVTRQEKTDFIDQVSGPMDITSSDKARMVSEIPDIRGKTERIICDPSGYVWLKIQGDDTPDWIVFTDTGELTASFNQPFEGRVSKIEAGRMYIITQDEDELPLLKVFELVI